MQVVGKLVRKLQDREQHKSIEFMHAECMTCMIAMVAVIVGDVLDSFR